jgi:hypothetical protein
MIFPGSTEIWFVLLYCLLTWLGFTLSMLLADPFQRLRAACVGGLLVLILASVLSMLAGFASGQLQTGLGMTASFQLLGVGACLMAVSRVTQMLNWPRTWLVAAYGLISYICAALILSWIVTRTAL